MRDIYIVCKGNLAPNRWTTLLHYINGEADHSAQIRGLWDIESILEEGNEESVEGLCTLPIKSKTKKKIVIGLTTTGSIREMEIGMEH